MRTSSLLPALALLAGCSLVLDVEELAPSNVTPHDPCRPGQVCDLATGQLAVSELAIAGERPFWISQGTVRTLTDNGAVVELGTRAERLRAWGSHLFAFDLANMLIVRIDADTLDQLPLPEATLAEPLAVGARGIFWSGIDGRDGTIWAMRHDFLGKFLAVEGARSAIHLASSGDRLVWSGADAGKLALFTATVSEAIPQQAQKWIDDLQLVESLVVDAEHVAWSGLEDAVHIERHDGTPGPLPPGTLRARRLALAHFAGAARLFFINVEGEVRSIRMDGTGEELYATEQNPYSELAVVDGRIVWASAVDGYVRAYSP